MIKYNNELKIVQEFKDCKKCDHLPVCIFHSKMSDLSKENIMYRMTEYSEWNNVLTVFELNSLCRYFKIKYPILKKGDKINLECDPDIINYIIRQDIDEIKDKLLQEIKLKGDIVINDDRYFYFQPEVNIDIVNNNYHLILKTTNKDIGHGTVIYESDIKISDVLDKWVYGVVSEQK